MKPNFIYFDTNDHPRLVLITRAAAGGQIVPRITITAPTQLSELNKMSAMEVRLSAKQSRTGRNVDIMSINFPEGSNSVVQTKVNFWVAPLFGKIPFWKVMDSDFAEIVDLTIRVLESINNSLFERE